jgi:hypothetical protein
LIKNTIQFLVIKMSSVQQQLAIRAKRLRLNSLNIQRETSDRELLSKVFSQWKLYKRFYEELAIIQKFMRSFAYKIKMRILKKNHREPDSATHSAHQIDWFIRMEQNREAGISLSYDLKNNEWTRLKVFLLGFVKTHNPVVDEQRFTKKLREMLSRDEFDIIKLAYGQSFIQFFESTRKTLDDIYNGCSTFRSMRMRVSDLLWILYYLSSEQLPKSWFPNPESDFAFVFEEMRTILSQHVQEDEERRRAIMESGPAEQPDYCPEPCSLCGSETIQGSCFDVDCMRRRESGCPACGNPIEGNNAVEVDGMRFHQDCANHNQHNSYFHEHTEYSGCDCSSNDKTFVEGVGFFCSQCIIENQIAQ